MKCCIFYKDFIRLMSLLVDSSNIRQLLDFNLVHEFLK
jgi:hypothetical protein